MNCAKHHQEYAVLISCYFANLSIAICLNAQIMATDNISIDTGSDCNVVNTYTHSPQPTEVFDVLRRPVHRFRPTKSFAHVGFRNPGSTREKVYLAARPCQISGSPSLDCRAPGVLRPSLTDFSSNFVRRATISGCFSSTFVRSAASALMS